MLYLDHTFEILPTNKFDDQLSARNSCEKNKGGLFIMSFSLFPFAQLLQKKIHISFQAKTRSNYTFAFWTLNFWQIGKWQTIYDMYSSCLKFVKEINFFLIKCTNQQVFCFFFIFFCLLCFWSNKYWEVTNMYFSDSFCVINIIYSHTISPARKHLMVTSAPGMASKKPRPLRPKNREMIVSWFQKEEVPKKSGLDPDTGKPAEWFHGIFFLVDF